jgi:rubrerythrin
MEANGYQSPIELFTSPVEMIRRECDNQVEQCIYDAVQNVGVNVDKEELIKALRYDRNQYQEGYRAGKAAAQSQGHWEPSGFPEYPYRCSHCGNLTKEKVERSYCGSCGAAMDE